ncbi:hypothetical protein DH2020_039330 [Rehmannia glutinosa]|uniref:Flavin-containing monooxygenase n=1 Tax=Rehmannia glutinosa TaxID=99300 RepID=A0ABR0UX96_REHGL
MEKRVAIVGAGLSGLLACKYTASKGFNPIVFEAQDEVGGLWNKTIETTRLQSSKDYFQFSDFPWPSSVEDMFPHNTKVLEYLQSYAQYFELLNYIEFNSKVISIEYVGQSLEEMQSWEMWGGAGKAFGSKGKWNLKEYAAEFVVLCIGRFSGLADIPEFLPGCGPDVFPGKVLHSMDYAALDNASAAQLIKGKKIAVIGSGKSAVDIAFECAIANGNDYPCTVIQRTIHWMLPDSQPWGRRAMSKFVESYLRWKLPLKKYDLIPKERFVQEASSCQILFLPAQNFFDKVEDGSIVFRKSKQFSFCKEGLILDGEDNNPLKADIVIFATGYKGDEKLKNIFACPTFQNCIAGSPTSTIPLYR